MPSGGGGIREALRLRRRLRRRLPRRLPGRLPRRLRRGVPRPAPRQLRRRVPRPVPRGLPRGVARPRLAAVLCVATGLAFTVGAGACGSDASSSDFSADYNAAIARLDRASQSLASSQGTRRARSGRAISRQLDRFADLLAGTSRDLAGLEPPKDAAAQYAKLTGALDRSIASARRAAQAARDIQPKRQRAALRQLRDDVVAIARAQDALQRALETG